MPPKSTIDFWTLPWVHPNLRFGGKSISAGCLAALEPKPIIRDRSESYINFWKWFTNVWPPGTLPAHWGYRRMGHYPARNDNVSLIYVLLESTDGIRSTVRCTGRLAMWWTSPDIVLVLEDATHQVSLEQPSCSERQQANQEKMLHCC